MFDFFRKNFFIVFIIIVAIVVGFALTDLRSNRSVGGSNAPELRIGKKNISQVDIENKIREFRIAQQVLALSTFNPDSQNRLITPNNSGSYAVLLNGNQYFLQSNYNDFIINSTLLSDNSLKIGIEPDNETTAQWLKKIISFKTDGNFDPEKLNTFISNLRAFGIDESGFMDIVKNWVRYQRTADLLASGVTSTSRELEAEQNFRLREIKMQVAYYDTDANLDLDAVSEEDIKSDFNKNAALYKTSEKRSYRYVFFELPKDFEKLDEAKKKLAKSEINKKASELIDLVLREENPMTFETASKKLNLNIKDVKDVKNSASKDMKQIELYARNYAFYSTLNKLEAKEFSGLGYLVYQVYDIKKPEPKSYEQAKVEIQQKIAEMDAQKAAYESAQKLRKELVKKLKAGENFSNASESLGFKVKDIPLFTRYELSQILAYNAEKDTVAQNRYSVILKPGQISPVIKETTNGDPAIFFMVKKDMREPNLPDEKKKLSDAEKASEIDMRMQRFRFAKNREYIFIEWLRQIRDKLNIKWSS